MLTHMRKKIKGIWNYQTRRSFQPKTRGKYLYLEGNEENFIRFGARVLEESISLFHGKANPIRQFSVNELNNMNVERVPYFRDIRDYRMYQGSWEGRVVYVKARSQSWELESNTKWDLYVDKLIREIVVATQMATHNNSHKILGCCLETNYPILVYEWVIPKTLEDYIIPKNEKEERENILELKDRLRVAWEISHCVSYLHTAFPRPIIHREIKPKNVFLDIDNCAKLGDYSLSISIPEGEEFVADKVVGTLGYLDDQYLEYGQVRESTDVYSFGKVLLVVLSGKNAYFFTSDNQFIDLLNLVRDCIENKCINEIIDPVITTSRVTTFEDFQIQTTLHLALRCTGPPEERPTMEEVAIQLKNMMITRPESILPPGHQ